MSVGVRRSSTQPSWTVTGASVRGAAHRRRGLPNQDSIAWYPPEGEGVGVVLAIADGHGSPASPRSATGARLAVTAACAHGRALLARGAGVEQATVTESAMTALPRDIVGSWTAAVEEDLDHQPLSATERAGLETHGPDAAESQPRRGRELVTYGTTLLVALATDTVLVLQLGDGDILAVSGKGAVARPLPPDPRLVANETTSMCLPDAEKQFRARVLPAEPDGREPELVLLATDGYANSFAADEGFLQVGADLLDLARADGIAAVARGLDEWLQEASDQGSGDDITVGIVIRTDLAAGQRRPRATPRQRSHR